MSHVKIIDIYNGEMCGVCFHEGKRIDATHKVGEEFPPIQKTSYQSDPIYGHPHTQYICCYHFEKLMGRHSGVCALRYRAEGRIVK